MADIQFSKTLGVPCVHMSDGWVTEDGVFLPDTEADKAMQEGKLSSLYAEAKAKSARYDWKSAAEGDLVPVKRQKKKETFNPLQYMMLITAAGAMFVSFMLSRAVLLQNAGAVTGTVLALIMVLFESGAFTAAIELKKNRRYALFALFVILFCVVEVYSMSNTVQVFFDAYEKRAEDSYKEHSAVNGTRLALKALDEAIASKKELIASLKGNIEYYTENKWGVRNFTDALSKASDELSLLQEKKTRLLEETPDAVVTDETKKVTFFSELGRVTGKSERSLALLFALFPALFIDLIAPFSLAAGSTLHYKGDSKDD